MNVRKCDIFPAGCTNLVGFVEYNEGSFIALLRCILEILDVLAHNFAIRYEVALPIDHVRDHHDLIDGLIRELQRRLRCLYIICQNDWVRTLDSFRKLCESWLSRIEGDRIPKPHAYFIIHRYPKVVWHIELADVNDGITRILVTRERCACLGTPRAVDIHTGAFRSIDNLSVCVDGTTFCAVGQGKGHNVTAHSQEVRDVSKAQLEEKASMPKEVIRHLEVLFFLADYAIYDTFILFDEPFLDNGFHSDLKWIKDEETKHIKADVRHMRYRNTVHNSSYT